MTINFDDMLAGLNTGSTYSDEPFAYVPKNSKVYCVPIFDGRVEDDNPMQSFAAQTWDYYQGEHKDRYMWYLAVVSAEGKEVNKMPPLTPTDTEDKAKTPGEERAAKLAQLASEGYTHLAVPFSLGVEATRAFITQFTEGMKYGELNDDGAFANNPDVFCLHRDDNGARPTYNVTFTRKFESSEIERVYMPDLTLSEMAQAHGEFKDRMEQKNNPDFAPDSPVDETDAIDESQF